MGAERLTELQLLQRVLDGESGAKHELYCRFSAMAMAVCMRYVGDYDDACDVLQDSFVKVLSTIAQFRYRGEGSLKSWVMRVVVNKSIDCLRRRNRISFTTLGSVDELPDEEPDVGLLPPGELQMLIGRLPTGYRTVLNLFVFEQLSQREIAQKLGITESTASTQFLRAKRLLGKMIKEYLNREAI